MTTLIYTHPACAEHDTGPGHPECAARITAILDALKTPEFVALEWREAPAASVEQLTRIHPRSYVDRIMAAIPEEGRRALDADTLLSPHSGEAALRAAGATCAAVDAVMAGEADNAFCVVRPPGHHAEPTRAMGFCLFNSVAVAAAHGHAIHDLNRVAIVDFDVHHGNGTQAAFEDQGNYLYISTHQSPLYPGTGKHSDQGVGNILNLPLEPYSGSEDLRHAWEQYIAPKLRDFNPDFMLISAGFDAHRQDPLAQLNLETEDFGWLTRELLLLAAECCQGRVVSTLEGGYHLPALAASAAAHVNEMLQARR